MADNPDSSPQFEQLTATELFCATCKECRPVVQVLKFELPVREYVYRCFVCDRELGSMTDDDGTFQLSE